MKKLELSILIIIAIGFFFEKDYAINRHTNFIALRSTSEIMSEFNKGKYRFLGEFRIGPYATSSTINAYTDGACYYCSFFSIEEVEARNEKELRESRIFHKLNKDNKGYWYNDYYGEKSYLYNHQTYRVVQNIEREVYYQDWMRN